MQVLKISFVLVSFFVFCSFSFNDAAHKSIKYQQFLSKFVDVESPNELILDVRINQPLPVTEIELEYANLDRWELKKVALDRMLMREFDIFISEISQKEKGGIRPKTYEAEFLVKQTKNIDVVIYSEYQDARQYHKTYYVAIFNKQGLILAKERIGMSNKDVYTEVNLSDRLVLDAISIIDGQKLALSSKKIKIKRKGKTEILEELHPYLDEFFKDLQISAVSNYRLR